MRDRDVDYLNKIFKAVDDAIDKINERMAIVPNGKLNEELRGVLEEYRQNQNNMLRAGEFDPHALGAALIAMGKRLEEIKDKETQGALSVAADYVATGASALTDASRNLWSFVTGSTQEPPQKKPKIEGQTLDPSIFPLLDSVINKFKYVQAFFESEVEQKKYEGFSRGGDDESQVEDAEKFQVFAEPDNFDEATGEASREYETPMGSDPHVSSAERSDVGIPKKQEAEDEADAAKTGLSQEDAGLLAKSKKSREQFKPLKERIIKKMREGRIAQRELGVVKKFIGKEGSKREDVARKAEPAERPPADVIRDANELLEKSKESRERAWSALAKARERMKQKKEGGEEKLQEAEQRRISKKAESAEKNLDSEGGLDFDTLTGAFELKVASSVASDREDKQNQIEKLTEEITDFSAELNPLDKTFIQLSLGRIASGDPQTGKPETADEKLVELRGLKESVRSLIVLRKRLLEIRSMIQKKLDTPIKEDESSVDYRRNQKDLKKALAQLDDIGKIDLHRLSEFNAPLTWSKSMHLHPKMSALEEIHMVMNDPHEDPINSYLEKIENLHKVLVVPSAVAEKEAVDVEQKRESGATEKNERDVLIALYGEKYSNPEEEVRENLSHMDHAEVKERLSSILDEYMKDRGVIDKKLSSLQSLSKKINPKSDYDRKSLMSDYEKLQKTIEIIGPHINEKFKEKLESQKKAMESTLDVLNVKKPNPKVRAVMNIFRKNTVQDENAKQSIAERLLEKFKVKVPHGKSRESTGGDVNRPPASEERGSRSPRNSRGK